MAIKIRLKRIGKKNRPSYRVVAVDSRKAVASGDYIENLGIYDPLQDPAVIQLDTEKINQWKSKGAQLSERVEKLMKKAGGTK